MIEGKKISTLTRWKLRYVDIRRQHDFSWTEHKLQILCKQSKLFNNWFTPKTPERRQVNTMPNTFFMFLKLTV